MGGDTPSCFMLQLPEISTGWLDGPLDSYADLVGCSPCCNNSIGLCDYYTCRSVVVRFLCSDQSWLKLMPMMTKLQKI